MKNYLVSITTNLPYPKTKEIRQRGSRIAIAVKRAIDDFRKINGRHRIKELKITAKEL